MSRAKAIVLGLFTVWPIIYMIFFMCAMFLMMMWSFSSSGHRHSEAPLIFMIIFPLHFFTILEMIALAVIYIVYLFKTDCVVQDKKALWAVVLLLGGPIAMLVFWYLYIWQNQLASKALGENAKDPTSK